MFLDIGTKKINLNDIICFLNTKAIDFYKSKISFSKKNYEYYFKSSLLSALLDFERTIKGTFGCDIFLKNADITVLKDNYPNFFSSIFDVEDHKDLRRVGNLLEILRNINAHAFLSEKDFKFFEFDFSSLQKQPKMNESISYYEDGITVAGIIYLILNLLREESISVLTKKDFIFSIVSKGSYRQDNGNEFVSKISKVNLENEIRTNIGNNVIDSIVGSFPIEQNGNEFLTEIGSKNNPTFYVKGVIENNNIIIYKGSRTKIFYDREYNLEIIDEDLFIKLSNKYPPFVLLDILFKFDIHQFDKSKYIMIEKNKLLEKLNKPKFYVDKNLDILLLPKTISDFRLMSSILVDSIIKIILLLENYIYRTRKIFRLKYSSLGIALKEIGMPNDLIKEVRFLRNFAAHGYILNEYMIYRDERKHFTIDFIIDTFAKCLSYFKENQIDIYNNFSMFINKFLINTLISGKYKLIVTSSRKAIKNNLEFDKNDFLKKSLFVKNSFFNINKFEKFDIRFLKNSMLIKLNIEGFKYPFYLNNNNKDIMLFQEMSKNCGFTIINQKERTIISEYDLRLL